MKRRVQRRRSVCSLSLGAHGAPQLGLQASEEALHVSLGCVLQEALSGVLLLRQPGVGLVEVRVQTGWRAAATVQQLRGRRRTLP